MPSLILSGRVSSLRQFLFSSPDSNTSGTVVLGVIGTGEGNDKTVEIWAINRCSRHTGQAKSGLNVFREIIHLNYKPEVISWDVSTTIPQVDIFLKRTKWEEWFLVMKPWGFWYHPLPYMHLGEKFFLVLAVDSLLHLQNTSCYRFFRKKWYEGEIYFL